MERKAEIEALGGAVAVIGCGTLAHLKAFVDHVGDGIEVYTDPGLKLYDRLEFKRGLGSLASFTMISRGVRAASKGFAQGKTGGNTLQLGGVLLVTSDGDIVYRYASKFAGDHPDPSAVVEALKTVAASARE